MITIENIAGKQVEYTGVFCNCFESYYDQINSMYFKLEYSCQRYTQQKLAMRLYNQFKYFGFTLKQAWASVKNYFLPRAQAIFTFDKALGTPLNDYRPGVYNGD